MPTDLHLDSNLASEAGHLRDRDFVREIFSARRWKLAVALALCAFVVPLCGMLFGFYGSDTHFHFGSWVDAVRDWKSGVYFQGWAAGANYDLGDPRFCFYPPIPMLIGSLGLLLLPARLVMGAIFWVSFFVSGVSMYCLCRRMLSPHRSAIGALLYTLSFFLLVTAIKHGAIAEQMTDAFLPLLVAYFLDVLAVRPLQNESGSFVRSPDASREYAAWAKLAVLFALTWIMDVPVAVAAAYTLTIATVLIAANAQGLALLWKVLSAQALGVLAAGFYLVPTFLATKTVYAAQKLEFHVRTLFTTHTTQDMALSAVAVVLACVIGYVLVVSLARSKKQGALHLSSASVVLLLGIIAFFFQLSVSRPLWMHLPELRIVGFPHRFQVFLALALPVAVLSGKGSRLMIKATICVYVLLAVIPFYAMYAWARRTPIDSADRLVAKSMNGYEGAPEYVPIHTGAVWVNQKNESDAEAMPTLQTAGGADCQARVDMWNPERRMVHVVAAPGDESCRVVLKLYLHPFWHYTVDGQVVAAMADRRGLATVAVPPGAHIVETDFRRPMVPVAGGWILTMAAGSFLFIGHGVAKGRRRVASGKA